MGYCRYDFKFRWGRKCDFRRNILTTFSLLRGHSVMINETSITYLISRNPCNFHLRNLQFWVRFSFITLFGVRQLPWNWYQNMWKILCIFYPKGYRKSLLADTHINKLLRKNFKRDIRRPVPRKSYWVR